MNNNLLKVFDIVGFLPKSKIKAFSNIDFSFIEKDTIILVSNHIGKRAAYLYFYDYKTKSIVNIGLMKRFIIDSFFKTKSNNISTSKLLKHLFSFIAVMNIESLEALSKKKIKR